MHFIQKFYRHFPKWIALEVVLGVILILNIRPEIFIPMAIFILLALSLIVLIEYVKYSMEHCACYGIGFKLTPKQSLLLNFLYVILLAFSLPYAIEVPFEIQLYDIFLIISIVFLSVHMLCVFIYRNPQYQIQLLKKGKVINTNWIGLDKKEVQGKDLILVFASEDCPRCEDYLPKIKEKYEKAGRDILLLLDGGDCERESIVSLGYKTYIVNKVAFSLLAPYPPKVVHLSDGIIENELEGTELDQLLV